MRALSTGEERFINESTSEWQMMINLIISPTELPDATNERIRGLDELYKKEFRDYYIENITEEGQVDASQIQSDFDEKWVLEHPEFSDPKLLFAECNDDDKKRILSYFESLK
jgi:hypothetical protein